MILTLDDCNEMVKDTVYLMNIGDNRERFCNLLSSEQFKMIKNKELIKDVSGLIPGYDILRIVYIRQLSFGVPDDEYPKSMRHYKRL